MMKRITLAGCGVLVLASAGSAQAPSRLASQVHEWRAGRQHDIVRELTALLAIPNVATDSADLERNAEHLVGLLAARNISARVLRHPGSYPAVYGELRVPGATRTVMLYAHFDGQPVTPADWTHPPFTPTVLTAALDAGGRPGRVEPNAEVGEWRVYARSASDDKGPIIAMLAALDALRALGKQPTVNIKFFLEGGEEAGSTGLGELMKAHADLLRADLWLLADGPVHVSRRPQLVFGVRGVMGVQLTLYGPSRALHSGHYGNWAPNPASELAEVLTSLRDSNGNISIKDFYRDVRPLSAAERAAIAALPGSDSALKASLLLGRTEGTGTLADRIMQPALNVRGLRAGGVGEEAANAVPATATASIDFRLVPDQTPAGVRASVEQHLRGLGYHIVAQPPTPAERLQHPRLVELRWSTGPYAGYRIDAGKPFARALTQVITRAHGVPVQVPMLGGSLPVSVMVDAVGAPMVGLPIVNHDNNQHAYDENLRLQNLWDGIAMFAAVMVELDGEWTNAAGMESTSGKEPLTIGQYMELHSVLDVALAPRANRVAFVRNDPDASADRHNRTLWVIDAQGGAPRQVGMATDVAEPAWSPQGQLAYRSGGRVWLADSLGRSPRAVTPEAQPVATFAWGGDGRIAAVINDADGFSRIDIVDPVRGTASALTFDRLVIDALSWSPDGRQIAISHRAERTTRALILDTDISVVTLADGRVQPLVTRPGMDFGPEWSPDGSRIAFLTHDAQAYWIGDTYIAVVAAAGGAPAVLTRTLGERILPGEYALLWQPDSRGLLYTVPTPEGAGIARIGIDGSRRMLTPAGAVVSEPSLSADGATMAFVAMDATTPWELFMSSVQRFAPRRLVHSNPALADRDLGLMQRVTWRSVDGTAISGLLLLPTTPRPARGYPLITYLHGGPAWNFVSGFNPHGGLSKSVQVELHPVQVWAGRGYAVFMPNPRGSLGFGRAFRDAVIGDFGGREVDDVLSGVDSLIAAGVADGARLGVVGWSHGGGLTAQVVARTPRFRAAVVGAGMSDPQQMFRDTDIPPFVAAYFPSRNGMGVDSASAASFTAPLGQIRTPVMILHGESDRRMPVSQGERLRRILQDNGTTVEYVPYPGQGHGLTRPSTQRDAMVRMLEWFDRYLAES